MMALRKDRAPLAVLFFKPSKADFARVEELAEQIGLTVRRYCACPES